MLSTLTKNCMLCGKESSISVDSASLYLYNRGTLIQEAFPTLTASERETIKTGIHGECWDTMFGEED